MAYPDAIKAGALAVLESNDGNVYRTAKDLGLPNTTVESWSNGQFVNNEVSEIGKQKKEDLADIFERIARASLERAAGQIDEASYAQTVTGAAIAVDKMRLLRDQSTANVAVARPEHEYIAAAVKLLTSRGYTVTAPVEGEIVETID